MDASRMATRVIIGPRVKKAGWTIVLPYVSAHCERTLPRLSFMPPPRRAQPLEERRDPGVSIEVDPLDRPSGRGVALT
jgi:hypothetical protein